MIREYRPHYRYVFAVDPACVYKETLVIEYLRQVRSERAAAHGTDDRIPRIMTGHTWRAPVLEPLPARKKLLPCSSIANRRLCGSDRRIRLTGIPRRAHLYRTQGA